jgi:hypothetical protein
MVRRSAELKKTRHVNVVGRRKDEDRPMLRSATSLMRPNKLSRTPWAYGGDPDSLMLITVHTPSRLAVRFEISESLRKWRN